MDIQPTYIYYFGPCRYHPVIITFQVLHLRLGQASIVQLARCPSYYDANGSGDWLQ
jgi:hypothetical protein